MLRLRARDLALALAFAASLATPAMAGQLKDGIAAVERRDFGSARGTLEDYVKKFPADPRPYYYLSQCYKEDYQVSRVDEMLQRYRVLTEKRDRVLLTLDGAEPASVYRAMLKDDPTDLSARLLLIVSYIQSNASALALPELQALQDTRLPPELEDKRHAMWGAVYQQQGSWSQARAEFKEAWRLNVNHPLPAIRLPEIDRQEREAAQAAMFNRDNDNAARSFEALMKLGKELTDEGNFDGAIEALTQATTSRPDSVDAKAMLATAKTRGAEAAYQAGLKFMRGQNYGAAYEQFSSALKLDPTHPKARFAVQDAKTKADLQEHGSTPSN